MTHEGDGRSRASPTRNKNERSEGVNSSKIQMVNFSKIPMLKCLDSDGKLSKFLNSDGKLSKFLNSNGKLAHVKFGSQW
jgi:hypothetical protein